MTASHHTQENITNLLKNARHHIQNGNLAKAENICNKLITTHPNQADAMCLLGEIALKRNKLQAAITLITKAIAINPLPANYYFLLGLVYMKLGQPDNAIKNYHEAIRLNPKFSEAYNNLGKVLQEQGHQDEAYNYFKKAVNLNPNLSQVYFNIGNYYFNKKDLINAEKHYKLCLTLNNNHFESLYRLSLVYCNQDDFGKALNSIKEANAVCPDNPKILLLFGRLLSNLDRFDESIEQLNHCIRIDKNNPNAYFVIANSLKVCRQHDKAINNFKIAISLDPDMYLAYYHIGDCYKHLNQLDKAKEYADKSLELNAEHSLTIQLIAKILRRKGEFQQAFDEINKIPMSSNPDNLPAKIYYEKGFIYDKLKKYDESIQYFSIANQRCKKEGNNKHNKNTYIKMLDELEELFTDNLVNSWPTSRTNNNIKSPIFLIGFPRSGTTLLDQILDSHKQIVVLEEGPMIGKTCEYIHTLPGGHPNAISSLNNKNIETMQKQYFSNFENCLGSKIYNDKLYVDKMPLNIAHAGLIYRLFPDAKFILTLRHPLDACLSCFMQHFELNNAMANFVSIEDSIAFYCKIMNLWQQYIKLLPLKYHTIKYESLVNNFEPEVKKLLNFLDVDWDPAVKNYVTHVKNKSNIKTPSYGQVIKPIYNTSINRWKQYQKHLSPFIEKLNPHLDNFEYDID